MSYAAPALSACRVANASRSPQAADNTDVTGWDKNDEIVLAVFLDEQMGPWTSYYQLYWRDVTDSGSFAPVAGTGEVKYGTTTDLQDGTSVTEGEKICTTSAGGTWMSGQENEGDSTTTSFEMPDEYETELQFALNFADADSAHQYEFMLYDVGNSAEVGTCAAKVTIAAVADLNINVADCVSVIPKLGGR